MHEIQLALPIQVSDPNVVPAVALHGQQKLAPRTYPEVARPHAVHVVFPVEAAVQAVQPGDPPVPVAVHEIQVPVDDKANPGRQAVQVVEF